MFLNEEQKKIVFAKENKIIVEACPACGKTAVLIERIRFLVDSGIDPSQIVAITFTNTAANEMKERLGEKSKGIFIGTIHSYINFLLFTRDVNTIELLKQDRFDELFDLIEEHHECLRPVEHLLLDEAQDSTPQQFHIILDLINPKNFFFVGDPRQAIFVWANADPKFFMDLEKRSDVTTYYLTQNYRNARSILDYARSLILLAGNSYRDRSIAMRREEGQVISTKTSPVNICKTLLKYGDFKEWFVLCRTNQELNTMMKEFELRDVPYSVIKRADLSKEDMIRVMNEDTVKLMTIHAAKGLESKKVIVIGAKFYNIEEICISYVAATRAKDLLVWVKSIKKRKTVESWE